MPFANDGLQYFNIAQYQDDNLINSASYPLKVDTLPPVVPTINISNLQPRIGEMVRFEFNSSDSMSGLADYFTIKINGGLELFVKDSYQTSFIRKGRVVATVTAYDIAGNSSESSVIINVQ